MEGKKTYRNDRTTAATATTKGDGGSGDDGTNVNGKTNWSELNRNPRSRTRMIELGLHVLYSIYIESTPPSSLSYSHYYYYYYRIHWMICKKMKHESVGKKKKEKKKLHIIFNFHVACILFRFRSDVRRRILCNECTTLRKHFSGGSVKPLNAFQCAIYILPMCSSMVKMVRRAKGWPKECETCTALCFFHSIVFHSTECIHSIIFHPTNPPHPHHTQKFMYLYLRDIRMRSSASKMGRGRPTWNVSTNRGIFFFLLTNQQGATTSTSNRRHFAEEKGKISRRWN